MQIFDPDTTFKDLDSLGFAAHDTHRLVRTLRSDFRMTGLLRRMGLYSLLVVTEAIKEKVNREPGTDAFRRQAVTDGMRPLYPTGTLRVAGGVTVAEEILRTPRL